FKSDDVVIMTFPKCGTTWMQEIIWTMRNKLDFDTAKKVALKFKAPFLDMDSLHPPEEPHYPELEADFKKRHPQGDPINDGLYIDIVDNTKSPRTIKTHMPFDLLNQSLPDTCKVVYVARNPRDACVSYYHHARLIKSSGFTGDFNKYLEFWTKDLVVQGPFWQHVHQGWKKRDHPNVLFIFYEDLKQDVMSQLRRINDFLGTNLTEEELLKVSDHTSFNSMKKNTAINHTAGAVAAGAFKKGEGEFVRKGTTGDWRNYFTSELEPKFQAWMDKWDHMAKDVPFKYEL
ncbi:unnamed protein product, partial [Meganyctiphanes norvegica]